MAKVQELADEFRAVLGGRGPLVDALAPPLAYLILTAVWGPDQALWGSLLTAGAITAVRLVRRQALGYALGGLAAALLAFLASRAAHSAAGSVLPEVATTALGAAACALSLLISRPLVAWTSYLARRWPLGWYTHPRVRPAYQEVTVLWALFFTAQLALKLLLFQGRSALLLAAAGVLTGWPATIALLAVSYLYGTWRLARLGGPSVEEFRLGVEPPWRSQRRGF